jgi:membrane-bound lytic murein transglycosylase B
MLALLRRARAFGVLGAAGLLLSLAVPAQADTASAEAKAKAILARVQKVQQQVKKAEHDYDQSLAGVAASVNSAIQSGRASDEIAAEADAAGQSLEDRVRGLYMSGGPLAIYATLLSSGDITEFQNQMVMVGHVVSADRDIVDTDNVVAAEAKQMAATAGHRAKRTIQTARAVQDVAARVMNLLQQEQALLDQANAEVAHQQALEAARAAYAAQQAAYSSITTARINNMQILPPSDLYMSLYHRAAATCAGLSWTVVAAIGQVESGHGRNPSTSSAGAMGPMQFLPTTFAHYAVDGDHDGQADIMDPYDAIYSAAAYLCANGAGNGPDALYSAVWHYNHADWYVQMVLSLAQKYAAAFV